MRRQLAQRRDPGAGGGGADARRADAAAGGAVAQGVVGGTGMICFGWKGGIGTSSRVVSELGARVGVLVMANFGASPDLRVGAVEVGG